MEAEAGDGLAATPPAPLPAALLQAAAPKTKRTAPANAGRSGPRPGRRALGYRRVGGWAFGALWLAVVVTGSTVLPMTAATGNRLEGQMERRVAGPLAWHCGTYAPAPAVARPLIVETTARLGRRRRHGWVITRLWFRPNR